MNILITIAIIFALESEIHGDKAPTFHIELTPEERKHYFGTELVNDVPPYQYTSPQPIDRRRKREINDEVDANNTDYLEYVIEAFDQTTHLLLNKKKNLISPGCIVQHFLTNETSQVYPCKRDENERFYTGTTSNHSDSWVAALLCDGLHAVIGLPEKTLVVQPITGKHLTRTRNESSLDQPHIAYQLEAKKRSSGIKDDKQMVTKVQKARRRRDTSRRYVETAVVVDPAFYRFHGADTEKMVKTVMNIVAQRFLDPSLKSELYVTLNKVIILQQDQADLNIEGDSVNTLNSFCEWQSVWNPENDSHPAHADYVVLITKTNLSYQGNPQNTGLSRKGMCGIKTKCSVNEDSGLATAITIAHETGHVLGMNHDSEGNNCLNGVNIMSNMAVSGPNAHKWSECSVSSLNAFLSSSESDCLNDAPPVMADKVYEDVQKPGTIYSSNRQCKLMLGDEAEACEIVPKDQNMCAAIVCRSKPGIQSCTAFPYPMMDGTDCGSRKWCINGNCVAMGLDSPKPINGGWSSWSTKFSECSRTCGGGVKIRRRFCNNPEPMYGGHTCSGSNTIAELCNIQDCRTSQHQFLQEQCAVTDTIAVSGGRFYHWIPDTGVIGNDSCKIACSAEGTNFMSYRGVSKDGTECLTENAPFARCVNGGCKVFGCDGHMDSNRVFDQCGVCHGQGNTCIKQSGNFTGGTVKEFTTFVVIPAGSTGIRITQGNSYCYLSVVINGRQLFTETARRLSGTYTVGGVTVKYQFKPERLEIVGPTNATVTAQVYRLYGPPYVGVDPDVHYEYHTPTSSIPKQYLWKITTGECSKTCGTGMQSSQITCESTTSDIVEDYLCDINQKPGDFLQPCNRQACPPKWRFSQWSRCSRSCAGEHRERSVECVQENNNVQIVVSDRMCQGQAKPSTSSSCHTNECLNVWKVGEWSPCSETCARGLKHRLVRCYKSAYSNMPIADSECLAGEKPKTVEYCVVRPCVTTITGANCTDKINDCFTRYGGDVCTGKYKHWAMNNCMKSCGICAENPSDFNSICKDIEPNCNDYADGFCTNATYSAWAKFNCGKFCGYCSGCADVESYCATYKSNMCVEYETWASTHCQKFCGLCHAIKKRDVQGNSLIEDVPPTKRSFFSSDNFVPNSDIETDVITELVDDDVTQVPPKPICNTVLTDNAGIIDVIGKLSPGETCEKVIALPLDTRVLLSVNDMNVDCEQGDEFTIVDVTSDQKIPVCNSILDNNWLSTGSIVALKFKSVLVGHGYSLLYEAVAKNKTVTACSQHFTAVTGEVQSVRSPNGSNLADNICTIYITGTPGKSVQLMFKQFTMTDMDNKDMCVTVLDLEYQQEDTYCGKLSPFIWESIGSRVRIEYKQDGLTDPGFYVTYNSHDISNLVL